MSVRNEAMVRTPFRNAFAKHVGCGRPYSVKDVAEMVGKSPSLVEKWLTGCRKPCADTLSQLFDILGDAFVRHYVNPHGYIVRQISVQPSAPFDVMAAGAQAACVIAEAMQDGVIDRNEAESIDDAAARFANLAARVKLGHCG